MSAETIDEMRPWVPAGPHIGPDEDDLAMLAATGDPAVDIGGVALAIHRVGAAACEAVAREPLCDEYRLVEGLAAAREAFADPVVDAVSKSAGDTRYAGLLARDLFDTAERTALGVYGACISKGVAPPLAIQRAGLVYGVPADALGRYISVAAEPRAHPVAIADAADRVVLGWAAAVSREETEATKIDKRMDRAAFARAYDDGRIQRGPDGEFINVDEAPSPIANPRATAEMRRRGIAGAQRAPRVAEPGEVVEPKPLRQVRQVRQVKQVKRVKQQPAQAAPEPTYVRSQPQMRVQFSPKHSAQFSPQLQAAFDAQHALNPPTVELENDLMTKFNDTRHYGALSPNVSLSFITSASNAQVIYERATEGDGPPRLRLGHLIDDHTGIGAPELSGSKEHRAQIAGQVREDMTDGEPIETHIIRSEELEREGVADNYADVLRYARKQGYVTKVAEESLGKDNVNDIELGFVTVGRDYNSNHWYVVGPPPLTPYDHVVVPEIAELAIIPKRGEQLHGNIEGSGVNLEYELDPDQVVTLDKPIRYWNPRAFVDRNLGEHYGAWVNVYGLRPASDPKVDKALSPARQQQMQVEPRDAGGRWTDDPHDAPVPGEPIPVAPAAPKVRQIRQVKPVRRVKQVRQIQRPEHRVQRAELQPTYRARNLRADHQRAFLRAQAAVEAEESPLESQRPELSDNAIYQVFSPRQWGELLTRAGWPYVGEHPKVVDINTNKARHFIFGQDLLDGTKADGALRQSVGHIVENQRGEKALRDKDGEVRQWTVSVGDLQSWKDLYRDILGEMQKNPEIAQARLLYDKLNDEQDVISVLVNAQPVEPHVLVVVSDDLLEQEGWPPETPMNLHLVSEWKQSTLQRVHQQNLAAEKVDVVSNARMMIYRLQRADVHQYRMD